MVTQWLVWERSLWIAWLILTAGTLVLGQLANGPFSTGVVPGVAAYWAYLLLLVLYFRELRLANGPGMTPLRRLGPWGYVWRAYFIIQLAVLPLIWMSVGFAVKPPEWSVWTVMLGLPPVLAWLMFANDRIAVLRYFFARRGGGGNSV
jgi:hypothetical protein